MAMLPMIRVSRNAGASESFAGLSTAIGFPEHADHGRYHHDHAPDYGTEELPSRSRHILLLPGLTQIVTGTVALLVVKCELGDLLPPLKFAVMWIICSGIIGLCATVCNASIYAWITCQDAEPNRHGQPQQVLKGMAQQKYQRFSHYSLHAYQAAVLIGAVLNFVAAMHGALVFRRLDSVPASRIGICTAELRLDTSEAGWCTLWTGICLCATQLMVLVIVAIPLNRKRQSQATKDSPTAATPAARQAVHVQVPETANHLAAAEEHVESQVVLQHDTVITLNGDLRPTAALTVIPESPSNWSVELRLMENLPPRYSSVGLPFPDLPPPFASRRNTLQSIRSNPPPYREASLDGSHTLNVSSTVEL